MPKDYCHIDIETFSEENLKTSGVYRYAAHPSTEVLVVCYRFGHEGPVHVWIPLDDIPKTAKPLKKFLKDGDLHVQREMPADLYNWIYVEEGELRAWNAMFERVVLNTLGQTNRLDWIPVPISQWQCSMAKAAALGLRQALGLCAKDCGTHPKDDTGKMAMLQLCKPRKPSQTDPSTRWTIENHPDKYRVMYHYCIDDVKAESALDAYLPDLSPNEVEVYRMDQKINDRGILIDIANVRNAQSLVSEYKRRLYDKCNTLTGYTPTQTGKLAEWVRSQGYEIENLQAATIKEALQDEQCPPQVRQLLQIYTTYNMKAVSKFKAMELAADPKDNRLRGMFRYHSASTGRWSSMVVQLQNIFRSVIGDEKRPGVIEDYAIDNMQFRDFDWFRDLFDKNPMKVLASCVRGMLMSHSVMRLVAIDYAAIEARVVAWLAEQLDILEVFATDGRIYEYTAAKIFNVPVDKVTKSQRFIGKVAVLALGYQGGKVAFAKMAKNYGVDIPEAEADQIKTDWRSANPKIVQLWYDLENNAKAAVNNPGDVYQLDNKKIMFKVEGDWLWMRLPSGRRLAYYQPKLIDDKLTYMGIDTYTRQWKRCDTYGGKLCENAVQAIARDLLVSAMQRMTMKGMRIVGTVHDEVILEAPKHEAVVRYKQASELMTTLPDWAEGLPVAVDGFVARRYRK